MLDINQGKKAVVFARKNIEGYVKKREKYEEFLPDSFNEKRGAFVTIHTYPNHDLRGCIGIPMPVMKLKDAIIEGAISVTHDPRFPALSSDELDNIIIEVTVLSKPEEIIVKKPKEFLKEIKIGRDGLIVEKGFYRGLLLPQVPVEQKWDIETFLSQTCMKAGLMPDSWFDKEIKISRFSGQIFTEKSPNGDIEEKKIDG